ncbi:MAG TPA: ABC transporter ATP-binding protein [Acidimicrobiales bacterium]|jgi:ABC-type multidrug transport system ATPase subunit
MTEKVLQLRGLSRSYGDDLAVAPVSLDLRAGTLAVLVGPNGSGKTTLLRMCAGLLEPSEGRARVVGEPVGSPAARAATSFLPDTPVLYDDLSVWEHLEYVARLHGVEDWEGRARDLVARLGLSGRVDDLPSRFSRGLRQKAAIAVGFVRPFSVLLVDEPFVGLDEPGREALVGLVEEAAAGGAGVIVSTHHLAFTGRAARCLGIRDGELVYDGDPAGADVTLLVS